MISGCRGFFLSVFFVSCAAAQVMTVPSSSYGNFSGLPASMGLISSEQMTNNLYTFTTDVQTHSLESPSTSVSKLDLKAPSKARHEYDKGYQFLMRRNFQDALVHLTSATSIYPSFVAAHNALGTVYLGLGQNERAREEFAQAVLLDDHLPNSHMNLGCAELALKNYPAAEGAMQKASAIAPLDISLLTALAYGQFMNHDYPAVVATARQVHARKHKGSAIVHYIAAGALDAQGNLADEQHELDTLIQEEPTSAAAEQARQILQEIQQEQARQAEAKLHPAQAGTFSFNNPSAAPVDASRQAQKILEDLEAKRQIALAEAEAELDALIQKEPTSAAAEQARLILQEMQQEQARGAVHPTQTVTFAFSKPDAPTPEVASRQAQKIVQGLEAKKQIAEAEAEAEAESEPTCSGCRGNESVPPAGDKVGSSAPMVRSKGHGADSSTMHVLRASVDEVAVFFTATDHGKPVTTLTGADIGIQDDRKPPAAVLGFRNEAQLPLRLGLVIDTSDSIHSRFSFEQRAAINFLEKAVTEKNDLAFVVGVANSVLVVQDFTSDQKLISHAIDQLVPSGGTALWDAVAFAVDKLAMRPESEPVAKILVVISDGEDNSSSIPLKEAIKHAQHGEVAVYTVSTRDNEAEDSSALLGDHSLQTLAELTGGAAFMPGSIHRLNGSLADLQQVLRGRYLVSYKPARFERDGRYRSIDITAQKDGHKLRVYARKGYYASVNSRSPDHE